MIGAMSTSDRPASHRVSHQPPNYLTVRQAAERLGLSRIAVRLRIRRGTLRSVKRDGVVYVVVGDQATGQQFDRPANQHRNQVDQPTDHTSVGADAFVVHLESEIAWLRAELEAQRETGRELGVVIANLARALSQTLEAVMEVTSLCW